MSKEKATEKKSPTDNAQETPQNKMKMRLRDNKFLILVAVLVFSIIVLAGFVSDRRLDIRERFLWKGEVVSEDLTKAELDECKNELNAMKTLDEEDCPEALIEESNEGMEADMITVEEQLGGYYISFEYPSRFYYPGQSYTEDSGYSASVKTDQRWENLERSVDAFVVYGSDLNNFLAGYADPISPAKGTPNTVKIMGEDYEVLAYSSAEGGQHGGYYNTLYVVNLEEDLSLAVNESTDKYNTVCWDSSSAWTEDSCEGNENCTKMEDCATFEPVTNYDFKPGKYDIEDSFTVMESFTWEKVD